jgi:hypothetical protein
MHEYVFEKVFISFYFWLIVFLVIGTAFSVAILIRRRMSGNPGRRTESHARILPRFVRKPRKPKDAFSEKLGERVVGYMIDVSRTKDKSVLRDRLGKIRRECERLSREPLPPESKRIIATFFSGRPLRYRQHVSERSSTQFVPINYNDKTETSSS